MADAALLQRLIAYWLVCTATIGMQYAFGSLYVVVLDSFESSRSEAALVGALCAGLMDGLAALSGVIVQRIGSRAACIVGGVLAAAGLASSAAATAWWHLLLSYSLLVGVGHSLALFAAITLIGAWFNRALARAHVAAGPAAHAELTPAVAREAAVVRLVQPHDDRHDERSRLLRRPRAAPAVDAGRQAGRRGERPP